MATATARRVLVTGGAGFLGSHLCEQLLNLGREVSCVDNFFSSSRQNVAHLLGNPRFELMRHDVTIPLYVEVDEIFNLACPASPVHYQFDPVQTTKTSVHGAINMLGLAKRAQAQDPSGLDLGNLWRPRCPSPDRRLLGQRQSDRFRSCYDEGKRCAETLFFDYRRQHNLPIKVVRIFNTYGPRMHPHDGRVVSNFIVQALKGEDITIFGDGRQTRSFCYVDDLVDGVLRMMETSPDVTGPINIGNPNEFTIIEFAELVIEMTGDQIESQIRTVAFRRPTAAPAGHFQGEGRFGVGAENAASRGAGADDRVFR